jgi:hypothetical protein
MDLVNLRGISIRQPWAWLIFNDSKRGKSLKNIENRTRHTKVRGVVAVQASKTIDKEAHYWLTQEGHQLPPIEELETGKIVGLIEITDSVNNHPSYWKQLDTIGYVLKNPIKLKEPIEYKGQLGFFKVNDETIDYIADMVKEDIT